MDKTKDIITELKKSYAIELETIQNYLANSVDLDGADAEEVKKSLGEEIDLKLKQAVALRKESKFWAVAFRARWSCRGIKTCCSRRR